MDLDSEAVDWDINTTLYTPLPEPKIMHIAGAGDGGLDTVSRYCNLVQKTADIEF